MVAVSHTAGEYFQAGILPIENSYAGSVTEVYDLMEKYNCKIVRSLLPGGQAVLLIIPAQLHKGGVEDFGVLL